MKIAMGQMLVTGGEVEGNLMRGVAMIADAAAQGCHVVVLPECMDFGWTHSSARNGAQEIPGPISMRLCSAAHAHRIYVVAGLTERSGEHLHNTSILISPTGEILLKHRKIGELPFARQQYDIGEVLAVAQTPLGCVATPICADLLPESIALGHAVGHMGAQLIFSPCAWAVDAGHDNRAEPYGENWRMSYGELARKWNMTVVGVSNVGWITDGEWKGRKCIGCSLAVGEGGRVVAQGPYGDSAEALVTFEIPGTPPFPASLSHT
ncbi:MAG: carbon-nitrogen hydrolase family protein [Candidatus Sumerlaeaceae bacterium]